MNCGMCGEELLETEECKCPGSSYCTCEFEHHHFGCCEDYEELINNFTHDHPEKSDWDATIEMDLKVLDAHNEYLRRY